MTVYLEYLFVFGCSAGPWWPQARCCHAAGFPDVQYTAAEKHWDSKEETDYLHVQGNLLASILVLHQERCTICAKDEQMFSVK